VTPRREALGACLAEAAGTFLMVFFGTGTVFVAVATGALQGLWQVAVVWAVVIAVAIQATGALSGAHLNPAVTLAFWVWRRFPRTRVPAYVAAQLAGAFLASAVLYGLYGGVLAAYEAREGLVRGQPGSERSAMVFGEYFPNPGIFADAAAGDRAVGEARAMAAEGMGTAVLAFCIFALTDRRNRARPRGALLAAAIGLTVAGLIAVIAPLTQAGFNPARDFGPRLFAWLAGWDAVAIPGPRGGFFTVYILSPCIGGLVGAGLYERGLRRFLSPQPDLQPTRSAAMPRKRFLLVGGFLAAGKTTALAALARLLESRGQRPGVIANDQSEGLVDTARLSCLGMPIAEITGGCFCCRFDALTEAAGTLVAANAADVILAEPVGSCTDVRATVAYPLRRHFGEAYVTAPLSVLVDPETCAAMLGLDAPRPAFSEDVAYIYRKQLEEADILVINKIDRIPATLRETLAAALRERYPAARTLAVSCRTGEGLGEWLDVLLEAAPSPRAAMDVDYDRYAAGEAQLGWYNATADLGEPYAAGDAVAALTTGLRESLAAKRVPVAHLKCCVNDVGGKAAAAASLTATAGPVETTLAAAPGASGRQLVINLRAEADPELLAEVVADVVRESFAGKGKLVAARAFRPGRPQPTYRLRTP